MKGLCGLTLALAALAFANAASAGGPALVVDDDGADCPTAGFTAIQAAVTVAEPGSTILVCAGSYNESVTIGAGKDDIRLFAKGAPNSVVVDANNAFAGIHLVSVTGVLVEGFVVREGHEADILLTGASGNTIRKNLTTAAGHDGIELRGVSMLNLIEHNVSMHNPASNACGVQVTGGSVGNVVRHNFTSDNQWGLQIAGGSSGNLIFGNVSVGNRDRGIRHVNSSGNDIVGNRAFDNTTFGISLVNSTGVVVAQNHAFGNGIDLATTGGANTFEKNHCNTSSPSGLCEHAEGNGDSGH